MSVEHQTPPLEGRTSKPPAVRPIVVGAAASVAAFIAWFAWPSASDSGVTVYELSRTDGKPRFYATTEPKDETPSNLSAHEWVVKQWRRLRYGACQATPAAYSFPPAPVRPCSIGGLLTQCMEVSGTQYLIAVEVAGAIEFGHTNTLNGTQWVAACEHAIKTSDPILCYDYSTGQNFEDTLVLIREKPDLVKVVPRSKLANYEEAGLIRTGSVESDME